MRKHPFISLTLSLVSFASLIFGGTDFVWGQALERVRVGYSLGGLPDFLVVIPKEKRIFEQEGLEVEMILMTPGVGVTGHLSGDLDYSTFAGTIINAGVRGIPIKVVLAFNDRPLYSIVSRPQFRSVKELKSKVLGISSFSGFDVVVVKRILKENGIDADREVILRALGNTPERLAALNTGLVDAAILATPADLRAEKQYGLRRLVFAGDVMEAIGGGIGVSDRLLKSRPDQVKKMIRVMIKGMAFAKNNPEETLQIMISKWKLDRDVAEKAFDMLVKTMVGTGIASDTAVQTSIQATKELVKEKKDIPLSQVVDFSVTRQVLEELKQK